ncbi:MAG: translesion DNA synthesis-associated protein ImuA [Rubrivivax sp.]|nr:translesion DNA synthesis-associated protein ImuA [Rubrivivax sp.]
MDLFSAPADAAAPAGQVAPCRAGALESLHPQLWRGHQLGQLRQEGVATGWPTLDRELPGGGWPRRSLTELLLKQPGVGEMRLLAPALSLRAPPQGSAGAREGQAPRSVMLFDPPAIPCAWALAELGLDDPSLIVVHGREGPRGAALRHLLASADLLWALEQALRSGHAGAILAWLPERLRADALRRLQLAAQNHDGPVFLLRGLEARLKPSPAPLRLVLQPAGPDVVGVQILKRRGPPLAQPLRLLLPAPATRATVRQTVAAGVPAAVPAAAS